MAIIGLCNEEIKTLLEFLEMEESEKTQVLRAKRIKNIEDVLEDVGALVETYYFNEFSGTKSSAFLKKVISNQNTIDMNIFKRTWRSLNCIPKTMKVIREIRENLLCVGKRKEMITKKKTEARCWCSKTGLALNAKHIVSCCKKVSGEINTMQDTSLTSSSTTSLSRGD